MWRVEPDAKLRVRGDDRRRAKAWVLQEEATDEVVLVAESPRMPAVRGEQESRILDPACGGHERPRRDGELAPPSVATRTRDTDAPVSSVSISVTFAYRYVTMFRAPSSSSRYVAANRRSGSATICAGRVTARPFKGSGPSLARSPQYSTPNSPERRWTMPVARL